MADALLLFGSKRGGINNAFSLKEKITVIQA